jgi:hypothetical protein
MRGEKQYSRIIVEDRLRAVAMMHVEVHDQHPIESEV